METYEFCTFSPRYYTARSFTAIKSGIVNCELKIRQQSKFLILNSQFKLFDNIMKQVSISRPEDFDTHIPHIIADMQGKNMLLLQGPLGAGKTTFVKRLGKYLGIDRQIVSPTFAYTREYALPNAGRFLHLDLYRYIGGLEEILPIEIQQEARIICIEWPEMVPDIFDFPHLILNINYGAEKDSRTLLW